MVFFVIAKLYIPSVISRQILDCDSITPLPLPVVPEVKTMEARRSGSIS